MQPQFGPNFGVFNFFVGVTLLWGVITTVFWMIVGWRAMRAHERIADTIERTSDRRDLPHDMR